MTFVVLFLLAVVWAVYVASWLRNRSEHRNVNSISSFSKHLSVLERTSPAGPYRAGNAGPGYFPGCAPVAQPGSMTVGQARRRRRDVLFALVGAAAVTLVLAVVVGGSTVYLQLLADVLLVGYVVALVRAQRMAQDRRAKVRYLQPYAPSYAAVGRPSAATASGEVAYLVPRSASAN